MLIVSSNKGKIKEIEAVLKDKGFDFISLGAKYTQFHVEEDGPDFCSNALIKAKAYAERYNVVALADDSGLEVDALSGRPGVESARYAGLDATDEDRVKKLLLELKDIPIEKRSARFKCCICVYDPFKKDAIFGQGVCEGKIGLSPKGSNGFGYDPVFIVEGFAGKSMAELSMQEKNTVSHRARALFELSKKIS